MKLTFRGQSRVVYVHEHPVTPGSYGRGRSGAPIEWSSATMARGRVKGLGLSGDFRIEFQFDEAELRNWLEKYIEEYPANGLKLVSEMQTKAIIRLSESGEDAAAPE